ncbi:MAG: LysR family transcriptional regulator [Allobaculum sp.]
MLKPIRYFQSVVRNNSFSLAADECHISQSAISQQIQTLERELGFLLFERKNRKFTLTPAGEHFYKKSVILVADYERIVQESKRIATENQATLSIGFLRSYGGEEFHRALEEFSTRYPDVTLKIQYGNHEELYEMMKNESVDLIFNDQRRAFSDQYVNLILTTNQEYIEISSHNPIAALPSVNVMELKNTPCILVSSKDQESIEQDFYQDVIGFQGEFIYAQNLEEARMMVISGRGFLPVEGVTQTGRISPAITRIPLYRKGNPMSRNYCAFWKTDNSGYYVEEFAEMLQKQFENKEE